MKKNLIYMALGLFILSAASCTDEVLVSEQPQELRVTAGMGIQSRVTFVDGDGVTKTHWTANDKIGLYTSSQENVAYQALSEGISSEFKPSDNTSINPEEGKTVKAYYPYNFMANGNEVPLPGTISRKASGGVPAFMYSESTITNKEVKFTFKHVFAYLKVTVSTQQIKEYMQDDWTLDKNGIYIESEKPISVHNATFNMDTRQITHSGNTDVSRMFLYTDDMDYDSETKHTYLIPILPQPEKTALTISLFYSIKDNENQVALVYIVNGRTPEDGFEAGNVYEIDTTGGPDENIYKSSDYSQDGKSFTIQEATEGKGIDLIFLGEGFVDKDMADGGKYERRMQEAADKLFELEPYKSFRNRFNIYGVKVVSPTAEFIEGAEKRINENDSIAFHYAEKYKADVPENARMMIVVVYNTNYYVDRSYCAMYSSGDFVAYNMTMPDNTLIHEVGGHGIAKLADEYVEDGYESVTLPEEEKQWLDAYHAHEWGWYSNVDYNSTSSTVRWSRLLNDSRYDNDGLGIFEGAYTYGLGIYRPSDDSMMRHNIPWFNAASREIIYKAIMTLSEGEGWTYDYETFAAYDIINRSSTGGRSAVKQPSLQEKNEMREKHRKPVFIKGSLRDAARRSSSENNYTVPLR